MQEGNNITRLVNSSLLQGIATTTLIFSLPVVLEALGWSYALIPLPVLYYLTSQGQQKGAAIIAYAAITAGVLAILANSLAVLLFSFTLLPLGYSLARSVRLRQNPVRSGAAAILVLAVTWMMFWTLYGSWQHTNPYSDILQSLDKGIETAYAIYVESAALSEATQKEIDVAYQKLRVLLPRIFPALLLGSGCSIVWLNLLLGHWLLKKNKPSLSPWNNYRDWRLPEPLVWGVILAIIAMLLPIALVEIVGLNGIIVLGLLYFFQGLAVLSTLLLKWSLPTPFKLLIYVLAVIQAYGIILLAILGFMDVWLEFGKEKQKDKQQKTLT